MSSSNQLLQVIQSQFLHMDKQEVEKHTQWQECKKNSIFKFSNQMKTMV